MKKEKKYYSCRFCRKFTIVINNIDIFCRSCGGDYRFLDEIKNPYDDVKKTFMEQLKEL